MRKRHILFIGLLAALLMALLFSFHAGTEGEAPAAQTAAVDSSSCVYPKEYMHTHHMQVLEDWKNTAAHEGPDAVHETADGRKLQKNLSTCLACHGPTVTSVSAATPTQMRSPTAGTAIYRHWKHHDEKRQTRVYPQGGHGPACWNGSSFRPTDWRRV